MKEGFRILALDVGAGTQDVLLFEEDKPIESCVQMILPSPTVVVGERIRKATRAEKDVFLSGYLMGGGASVRAVKAHLEAGLCVYATPQAALTIDDNLDRVKEIGVSLVEENSGRGVPEDAVEVTMRDVDLDLFRKVFSMFDISLPQRFAVAVQDHGYCPQGSNRRFRFAQWKNFVEAGGRLEDLVYTNVPDHFTRMRTVQDLLPGAVVMDTWAAAVWGALSDPWVESYNRSGLIVVNIGNAHTVGVLLKNRRVWGIFEHHTSRLTTRKLKDYLIRFREGRLTNDEIYEDGGHGAYIHPRYRPQDFVDFVAVTGPNRMITEGLDYYLAAPFGDMMLTGCFGLIKAARVVWGLGESPFEREEKKIGREIQGSEEQV